ncbi:hypothetical protein F1559_001833 [Cyanidiococcus yangmingshanensis]|uniref:Glycosyltransferase 2-like domain-containing protein n=1 Tax=Cyanidiococcus yangmingshanensis TaxID=2690220 RepID=A0A7J7IEU1_9RHOD|nr:hypothetical protein F1559_001833 [Cyanidiococcus yangmingshanensis]
MRTSVQLGHSLSPVTLSQTSSPLHLSVIIPVLNEADKISDVIQRVYERASGAQSEVKVKTLALDRSLSLFEVIVVDGGSMDATCASARKQARGRAGQTLRVVQLPSEQRVCRANQLNWGAQLARGDVLLFLHADTTPPNAYPDIIARVLCLERCQDLRRDPGLQCIPAVGAFSLQFAERSWKLRLVAWGANMRSRLLHMPYGDQGMFLRRDVFDALGGFPPDWPLLEDVSLVRRAHQRFGWPGAVSLAPEAAQTSARRYQQMGVLRTVLLNQCILLGHALGISVETLARWYRSSRSRSLCGRVSIPTQRWIRPKTAHLPSC